MKYMKKILLALAFFTAASFATADGLVLNGVTTTGASESVNASGQEIYAIDIQVWSTAGSVSTVLVECRSTTTAPWWPCATITNVDATGQYFSAPLAFQYRLNVTAWTSGTIFGTIILYQ